jgi:hypothetical protein
MTTNDPSEVLTRFLGVLTGFDAEVLMPLLGPQPSLEFPYASDGLPRVVEGRDDVEKFWHTMGRMFRELHAYDVTTHAMVEDGLAMATWRSDGTTAGKPRPYRNTYISLARVSNGLVDWYCEYFDPIAGLRAFDRM